MFNIIMVEGGGNVIAYRRTIGRIHVDAVLTSNGDEPLSGMSSILHNIAQ